MPASTAAQKTARAARRGAAKPAATTSTVKARKVTEDAPKTATPKRKPAARKGRTTSADATTVTVTLTRNADLPKGNGGVRYNEVVTGKKEPVIRTQYIGQKVYKAMGEPMEIEVTITAK